MRAARRDLPLQYLTAGSEITDSKGKKVGKVVGSIYNSGIGLIDIGKLGNSEEKYFLDDKRVAIW